MPLAELGVWLGLILGICGGAGFFLGGYIADRLGRGSHKKAFHFIAVTLLLSAALLAMMFLARTSATALLLFILPAATMNVYLAPVLSQAQSLVGLRMRATTSALVLLVINLIGYACGPWTTGTISDLLKPEFGEESMRYSLLIVTLVIMPWAVWHYLRAGHWIDADLARARDHD
jgi:predicted MFS family arabinose efflux permease